LRLPISTNIPLAVRPPETKELKLPIYLGWPNKSRFRWKMFRRATKSRAPQTKEAIRGGRKKCANKYYYKGIISIRLEVHHWLNSFLCHLCAKTSNFGYNRGGSA
jgi:hypothetical protein